MSNNPSVTENLNQAMLRAKEKVAQANVKPDEASFERVLAKLRESQFCLLAHYYADAWVQRLAEASGGLVGDSLELAKEGQKREAQTLIIAGVRFMGETAKILSPEKTIYVLDSEADCSLDILCPADAFIAWREAHPERTAVVYANTSAAVKAHSDWVVTSSIALPIIKHLKAQGIPLLWASDRYLGRYLQAQTGADMLLWDAACVVHEEFNADLIKKLAQEHPEACILAHPESPESVLALADEIGSTSKLIQVASQHPASIFIVATEQNIFYRMQAACPDKTLLLAPSMGKNGHCRSCGQCPWMALNHLKALEDLLEAPLYREQSRIELDFQTMEDARKPIMRMLAFKPS